MMEATVAIETLLNAIKSAPHLPTDTGRKLNFSWELYNLRENEDKPEIKINALHSLEAFMSVANQHRPYEPSDFVKEYFIPDNI